MDEIRTVIVSAGCIALVCGLTELIAPKDRFRGAIETVIGLFALIAIVSSLKSCSFDDGYIAERSDEIISAAQDSFDDTLNEAYSEVIRKCYKDKLNAANIQFSKIKVELSVKESIVEVEKVIISASEKNSEEIMSIGNELGFVTVVEGNGQ